MDIKNNLIKKLKQISKLKYITILVIIILAITITLPTLARYKNRLTLENILETTENWDGTVATSYHSGTGKENNPYIISNAKELAYFANQLQTTTYENTYFKLSNNIIINNGTFTYQDNKVIYSINDTNLYLKEYTTELYDTEDYQNIINTLNSFTSLNDFKGHFDGNYYRIYGLYMTSETEEELGLFKNLSGTVKNLYLENTMIYGASSTAALASSATNATIENIHVKGNVIGKQTKTSSLRIYNIEDYTMTDLTTTITLPTRLNKTIKHHRIKGTYSLEDETQTIKINNEEIEQGDFTVNLGTDPITEISLEKTFEQEVNLTNLVYEVEYEIGITSGIVAKATSTTLNKVINKANVYGNDEASGLIGITTNTNLTNAYNTGDITSTTKASGLVSSVQNSDNVVITKAYNTGTLSATTTNSFVNDIINNGSLTITDAFNTSPAQLSFQTEQDITISNVYDVNTSPIGKVVTATPDQTTIKTILNYTEYVDKDTLENNPSAIWIYENNNLPIIYIDDLVDPIAVLNVGTYHWQDIGYELEDTYLTSQTAFKISPKDQTETITAYYYIHKEKRALSKTEIEAITDWTEYKEIVSLTEEGYYVIYVKAIDSEGNIKYINSEQLILDLEAPKATITMNDKTWTTYKEDLTNINISETTNITISTEDTYSTVTETKYYISNIFLTKTELEEILPEDWIDYQNNIILSEKGTYIINVKTTDSSNHTAYYNTDYIVFGGFEETLNLGRNTTTYDKLNITNTSEVTYNFTYNDKTLYQEGYKVVLQVPNTLPVNAKITLINNNTKKVYTYKVEESKTKYNLNEFIEIGQTDQTKTFNYQDFINESTKNISLVFDFKNTTTNIIINPYIEIHNSSNESVLSTLKSTIKETTVFTNNEPTLIINNLNEVDTIHYNSDSITTINLETYLSYKINNTAQINLSLDNKKLGLAIKLIDKDNNIVSKKYLKNILFEIGDNYYTPDNDGIVRINISDEVVKVTNELKITTYASGIKLPTGQYQFVITPFISSDGKYTNEYATSTIKLPVTTTAKDDSDYGFNVTLSSDDKILYKNQETTTMNFQIKEISTFTNPNIRVSLHKKYDLSAYNQTYNIIDLQDYTLDELTEVEDNIYYVTSNEFALSMNTTKFDKTGYELKFDLYDGTTYITSIKKKFIVR